MTRKTLLMLCFVFFLSLSSKAYSNFSENGFALGFGVTPSLNVYGGYDIGGSINLKMPKVPIVFTFIGNYKTSGDIDFFGFGINMDVWIFRHKFTDLFHMYMGPGIIMNIDALPTGNHFDVGFRAVIGFQFLFNDKIELFIEGSPNLAILFVENGKAQQVLEFGASATAGLRFWI